MTAVPPWLRSKCRPDGVMTPRAFCTGGKVHDDDGSALPCWAPVVLGLISGMAPPGFSVSGLDVSFFRAGERHRLAIGRPRLHALQIVDDVGVRLEVIVEEISERGERKHHHHV